MREIIFRGKRIDNGEWVEGYVFDNDFVDDKRYFVGSLVIEPDGGSTSYDFDVTAMNFCEVYPETICQYTGLTDKSGKKIWENDILMGHGNREDLVKVVYGEFPVINTESLEAVDKVIGWHYEVIPTDALSKCKPFCLPMPLTEEYVKTCEFEVVGNVFDQPELLEV